MEADDRRILEQLAQSTGMSRAEILRRGLRSFAAEQSGENGPMQALMQSLRDSPMRKDLSINHDAYLEAAYTDRHDR